MLQTKTSTALDQITSHYLSSREFNGTLITDLGEDNEQIRQVIKELLLDDKIVLNFGDRHENPYILALEPEPKSEQLAKLDKLVFRPPKYEQHGPIRVQFNSVNCCAYPSSAHLKSTVASMQYQDQPYTRLLALGEPQLKAAFFELHVLEKYFHDPRYHCYFADRDGSISVRDAHYLSEGMKEKDKVLLQTFGIGYDEQRNRVVVAFLRYLSHLSPEHQQIWKAQEIAGKCKVNRDYLRASIFGEWPEYYSVYEAFIHEQVEINKLASMIGKPALFKNTFEEHKRPIEFSPMLRPTLQNFRDFAHTLDKMLSDNMDREFFRGDISLEDRIEGNDGSVEKRPLGTITLLERWLSKKYRRADGKDASREVVGPFREVRKIRQPAAHAVAKNEYDPSYANRQDELLGRVKQSLTKLRLIFSSHPMAKNYSAPEWLDGDKIVFF